MAAQILTEVILPAKTGITKDEVINTFSFQITDTADATLDAVASALIDFYNTAGDGQTNALAHYIGYDRTRTSEECLINIYNITAHLNGSAHGAPIKMYNWTLAGGTTQALPAEVALVLSFHGSYAGVSEFAPGSRPRARHRGRIYLGTLSDTTPETGADTVTRPSGALITDLVNAGNNLREFFTAPDTWVVWSRSNAAVYPVTTCWVDNAFDTIRNRGPESTERTTLPVPV